MEDQLPSPTKVNIRTIMDEYGTAISQRYNDDEAFQALCLQQRIDWLNVKTKIAHLPVDTQAGHADFMFVSICKNESPDVLEAILKQAIASLALIETWDVQGYGNAALLMTTLQTTKPDSTVLAESRRLYQEALDHLTQRKVLSGKRHNTGS